MIKLLLIADVTYFLPIGLLKLPKLSFDVLLFLGYELEIISQISDKRMTHYPGWLDTESFLSNRKSIASFMHAKFVESSA